MFFYRKNDHRLRLIQTLHKLLFFLKIGFIPAPIKILIWTSPRSVHGHGEGTRGQVDDRCVGVKYNSCQRSYNN